MEGVESESGAGSEILPGLSAGVEVETGDSGREPGVNTFLGLSLGVVYTGLGGGDDLPGTYVGSILNSSFLLLGVGGGDSPSENGLGGGCCCPSRKLLESILFVFIDKMTLEEFLLGS